MKSVKKWLFPVLTCLIVVGAAVLPARISLAQDAQQFGQIHTETLDADAVPVRETPTLLDRMALYSSAYSTNHPILSFRDALYFEDSEGRALAQAAQELMTEARVLPEWIFQEEPFDKIVAGRILLWDPAGGDAVQEPSAFWEITWSYDSNKNHQKSIKLTLDAETGLPLYFFITDTNMSQWLPYELDDLRALAERYFDLLGIEAQEVAPSGPRYVPSLDLSYVISGSPLSLHISRHPTALSSQLEMDWQDGTVYDSSSASYDG